MSDDFESKARDLENTLREQVRDKEETPLIKDSIVKGQPDVIFPSLEAEKVEEQRQPEEEPEEEYEEDEQEVKPKKRHYSLKSQLQDMQRDKHRAIAEAEQYKQYVDLYNQALAEKEELKRHLSNTEQGMLYTKQENIANRIGEAKRKKEDSRVTGDVGAETNADIELQLALRELDRFNEVAARVPGFQYNRNNQQQPQEPYYAPQEQRYQQPQQYYPQNQPAQPQINFHPDVMYNSQNFDKYNSWNDRNSRDYDESFSNEFVNAANEYNQLLYKNGQSGQIGSAEYFQKIQDWVNENRPAKNNLSLNKSSRYVAPAGNSGRGGRQSSQDVQLTEGQKKVAESLNMTHDEFRPYVAKWGGR